MSTRDIEIKNAKKCSVDELIFGACTSKHGAVYRDELVSWVEEEQGRFTLTSLSRFLEREFGGAPSEKLRAPDEPLEAWEIAQVILDSAWLAGGAKGIRSYRPRRYRGWLKRIIAKRQRASDLSEQSRALLAASTYHAGIDCVIKGIDN